MKPYRTKAKKIAGTNFREIHKKVLRFYGQIKKKSKRKPYVRSTYFKKEKIFLDLFWGHVYEKKNYWDQTRRIMLFPCAIELITHSCLEPTSKENPNKPSEILHRFAGVNADNELFFVQIKEAKQSGKKWLISVFPIK